MTPPTFTDKAHTKNLTITCRAAGSNYIQATFMQISKVKPDGSISPMVELLPGAQQPTYVNDNLIRRSRTSGNLDKGQGQSAVYLEVVFPQPLRSDIAQYRCDWDYLRSKADPVRVSATASLVWTPSSTTSSTTSSVTSTTSTTTATKSTINQTTRHVDTTSH